MPRNSLMKPDERIVTSSWLMIIDAATAAEINEVPFVPFWNEMRWNFTVDRNGQFEKPIPLC